MNITKKITIIFCVCCLAVVSTAMFGCDKTRTVTFVADGQSCLVEELNQANFYIPTAPEKDGYTFGGWYFEESFANRFDINSFKNKSGEFKVYARYVRYWNGLSSKTNFFGDGSEKNPYLITTAEEFYGLSLNVNNGNAYKNKYFRLDADINLNGKSWTPIGNGGKSFGGHFNGNGATITNLKIDANFDNVGLFGSVTGSISNLTVSGEIDITATGVSNAGMVSGYISGNAERLKVQNATLKITSSYGNNVHIGGIFGYVNQSTINLCGSEATVSGVASASSLYVGGLGGYVNNSSVADCTTLGSIDAQLNITKLKMYIGGISGTSVNSDIKCCKTETDISATSLSTDVYGYIGGISGSAISSSTVKGAICKGTMNPNFDGECYSAGIFGKATDVSLDGCLMLGNVVTSGEKSKFSDHIIGSYENVNFNNIYVAGTSSVKVLGVEKSRKTGNSVCYEDAVKESFENKMLGITLKDDTPLSRFIFYGSKLSTL